MQEQKKYQIESVEHSTVYDTHNCCVIDYYPISDRMIQLNFTDVEFAKSQKLIVSTGMWKPKKITDKN